MGGRIEALDQELKKLKEIVLRLAPLCQQELLNYRTIETQHGQLREKNTELANQNAAAEETIRKAVESAELIVAQAKTEEQAVKASIMTLYAKANIKYKELEKSLDDADRKSIRKQLKDLEEVAA